ncbi:uncharacterized protein MELLADRAFT_94160 [Melampsora larici-populina 98AG31]|uniref:non-specific serine/threonine protein kinase n=1 Tax=Melampsora larici-populina (strain 98AG31 / pathotype 3-4-7) TaxID=747676 RepID=F4S6P5_MELLP|nr:uncharacterized protein MELLADRAFT_94160 [Melampsora larici-populina 98AG31]EGF99605.1 hypothetical protein MELLADRAFT_94160 [Melampsora larici-populina 98AG31]
MVAATSEEMVALSTTQINDVFKRYCPTPVMVIVDVRPDRGIAKGSVTYAYFAIEEIKVECKLDVYESVSCSKGIYLHEADLGLIHGDFNEFNILIVTYKEDEKAETILIDFPQMVPTEHTNTELPSLVVILNRDVKCICASFLCRFRYRSKLHPIFNFAIREGKRVRAQILASSGATFSSVER